jgi:hypothetical protein
MADHTITISNSLSPVGVGPVQLWNVMEWGEQWGSSADVIEDIMVAPDMADLTLTPSIAGFDVTHIIDGNTLTLSDAVGKDMTISIINAITFTEDLSFILKQLGDWDYVFPLPTTDGRNKQTDGFDLVAGGDDDFSKVANGSDNWS